MTTSIPGTVYVTIPFPEPGEWQYEGQSLDLGPFRQGMCAGNLYKTADNCLHVFVVVETWTSLCVKARIPLRVPAEDEGASTLRIHWRDTGVVLQQDTYPSIHVDWQRLH